MLNVQTPGNVALTVFVQEARKRKSESDEEVLVAEENDGQKIVLGVFPYGISGRASIRPGIEVILRPNLAICSVVGSVHQRWRNAHRIEISISAHSDTRSTIDRGHRSASWTRNGTSGRLYWKPLCELPLSGHKVHKRRLF